MLGAGHKWVDLIDLFQQEHKIVVFPHLHKTGGSSIESALNAEFEDRIVRVHTINDRENLAQLVKDGFFEEPKTYVVHGHNSSGLLDHLPADLPKAQFTFLRHPLRRFASFYSFSRLRQGDDDLTWNDYLEDFPQNSMLKFFNCKDAKSGIDMLRNEYHFVGTTEMFDSSFRLMHMLLGMQKTEYQAKTVVRKEDKHATPLSIIPRFINRNVEDIKFFEYASEASRRGLKKIENVIANVPTATFIETPNSFVKRTQPNTDLDANKDKYSLLLTGKELWDVDRDRALAFFRKAIELDRGMAARVLTYLAAHAPEEARTWAQEQLDEMGKADDPRLQKFRARLETFLHKDGAKPAKAKPAKKTKRTTKSKSAAAPKETAAET